MKQMNRSIYIIKPEAMHVRAKIRNLITESGLRIVRAVEIIIPASSLNSLYTDLNSDLRKATQLFMGNEPCEIGEVAGENAVNLLLAVCGHSTDPSQCTPKSVRGLFGIRQAESVGSAIYFKNAIHRPKTEEEARRDFGLFQTVFAEHTAHN